MVLQMPHRIYPEAPQVGAPAVNLPLPNAYVISAIDQKETIVVTDLSVRSSAKSAAQQLSNGKL